MKWTAYGHYIHLAFLNERTQIGCGTTRIATGITGSSLRLFKKPPDAKQRVVADQTADRYFKNESQKIWLNVLFNLGKAERFRHLYDGMTIDGIADSFSELLSRELPVTSTIA